MNAHKHMEAIFAVTLVIGCAVALMPSQQPAVPGVQARAMPVVVITGKRMTPMEKRHALASDSELTTAAR